MNKASLEMKIAIVGSCGVVLSAVLGGVIGAHAMQHAAEVAVQQANSQNAFAKEQANSHVRFEQKQTRDRVRYEDGRRRVGEAAEIMDHAWAVYGTYGLLETTARLHYKDLPLAQSAQDYHVFSLVQFQFPGALEAAEKFKAAAYAEYSAQRGIASSKSQGQEGDIDGEKARIGELQVAAEGLGKALASELRQLDHEEGLPPDSQAL